MKITSMVGRNVVRSLRKAYSLMEMVLVVALLVVLAGLSYPVMESYFASGRLSEASDLVRARWTETRSRAMQERRAYRFAIKENTGKFRIAPDSAEFWEGGARSDGEVLVVESDLPSRVQFGKSEAGAGGQDWQTLVTFLPDGSAQEDVEVPLSTRGSRIVTLRLRAVTGTSSVASLPGREKSS